MVRKRRQPRYIREEPPSPRPPKTHRIEADLSQQAPNNSYGPPAYYEDYEFICVDCGKSEIWTAEQQKWWYEVAKGSIYSGAKRCRSCRNALRDAHGGTVRRSQEGTSSGSGRSLRGLIGSVDEKVLLLAFDSLFPTVTSRPESLPKECFGSEPVENPPPRG